MCLLLVLCANEAADVRPNPLQDDQEGQQVEEQSDSLERDGGMEEREREADEGNGEYRRETRKDGGRENKGGDGVARKRLMREVVKVRRGKDLG